MRLIHDKSWQCTSPVRGVFSLVRPSALLFGAIKPRASALSRAARRCTVSCCMEMEVLVIAMAGIRYKMWGSPSTGSWHYKIPIRSSFAKKRWTQFYALSCDARFRQDMWVQVGPSRKGQAFRCESSLSMNLAKYRFDAILRSCRLTSRPWRNAGPSFRCKRQCEGSATVPWGCWRCAWYGEHEICKLLHVLAKLQAVSPWSRWGWNPYWMTSLITYFLAFERRIESFLDSPEDSISISCPFSLLSVQAWQPLIGKVRIHRERCILLETSFRCNYGHPKI